jgi:hypothetical protein
VEGDETSYDTAVYSALFPGRLVIPRQKSAKVVEATKTMASLNNLHHLEVSGLVDRDRRGDDEIAALKKQGLMIADVAEVENLLCLPEAIGAVAKGIHVSDLPRTVKKVQAKVLDELRKSLEEQYLGRALGEIQFQLNGFGPKIGELDAAKLPIAFTDHIKSVDPTGAMNRCKALFEEILSKNDYRGALRYFNCKGIPTFVAGELGMKKDAFIQMVLGILKSRPEGALAKAMRKCVTE